MGFNIASNLFRCWMKMREREREKERKRKNVHSISIKKSTIKRERERKEEKTEREKTREEKEDSRQKHCVYISLLLSVHDIPRILTIKQQYQIGSLATFLPNQVSIDIRSSQIFHFPSKLLNIETKTHDVSCSAVRITLDLSLSFYT